MSNNGSESPKDELAGRLERDGFAIDIRPIPGSSEYVAIRDVTLAWAIIRFYASARGPVVLDRWDYESYESAKAALDAWTPGRQKEPEGWTRHPASQRMGRSDVLKSISKRR